MGFNIRKALAARGRRGEGEWGAPESLVRQDEKHAVPAADLRGMISSPEEGSISSLL